MWMPLPARARVFLYAQDLARPAARAEIRGANRRRGEPAARFIRRHLIKENHIAAAGGIKAALEHFSVDLPKERARRQYEQYGEREATQGKSLKNTLDAAQALDARLPIQIEVETLA